MHSEGVTEGTQQSNSIPKCFIFIFGRWLVTFEHADMRIIRILVDFTPVWLPSIGWHVKVVSRKWFVCPVSCSGCVGSELSTLNVLLKGPWAETACSCSRTRRSLGEHTGVWRPSTSAAESQKRAEVLILGHLVLDNPSKTLKINTFRAWANQIPLKPRLLNLILL